eukprot:6554230-Prymnesium_polylepis.1
MLACCPAGTVCRTFGPVWGMCMPSWPWNVGTVSLSEELSTAEASNAEDDVQPALKQPTSDKETSDDAMVSESSEE